MSVNATNYVAGQQNMHQQGRRCSGRCYTRRLVVHDVSQRARRVAAGSQRHLKPTGIDVPSTKRRPGALGKKRKCHNKQPQEIWTRWHCRRSGRGFVTSSGLSEYSTEVYVHGAQSRRSAPSPGSSSVVRPALPVPTSRPGHGVTA